MTTLPTTLYAGTAITTTVTFTVPNDTPGQPGTLTDPSTVTLKFQSNAGTTTWVYGVNDEITRSSTGVYSTELDTTDTAGGWTIEWIGTGACAAVQVAAFYVTAPPL